jgi:hypothetical protein
VFAGGPDGDEAPGSSDTGEAWSGSSASAGVDFGKMLRFDVIERGLKELNCDISLDVPVRRSSDWSYMFEFAPGADESSRRGRAAVYYGEKYICALDRGDVPEIKIYGVEPGWVSIPMSDIHKWDDSKVSYMEILPESPYYHLALSKAQRKDDNYTIADNGKVFLYEAMRWTKTRGPVQKLGWRHTFEALLRAKIAGVTRESLAKKFGVDMLRVPVGSRDEIHDALFAE